MANSVPASPKKRRSGAQPQLVGGRFAVEGKVGEDALGELLSARDRKTQRPILLRVFAPPLFAKEKTLSVLRAECRTAAELAHPNIVATYGVGADPSGPPFLATEWVEGTTLAELVQQRLKDGKRLSLRGAYNVLAHVCKAFTYAHAKTVHGGLRPSTVWVSRSGRVKVSDFGVFRAVRETAGCGAIGGPEQIFLAPEVKAGKDPSARSDVFGLGALLYVMLTGRMPSQGFVPPSQVHPEATPAIDQVLLRCLAADPASRFASADEVRLALLPHMAEAREPAPAEDFGVAVDIDIDLASIRPGAMSRPAPDPRPNAAPQAAPRGTAHAPSPPTGASPAAGTRVSMHEPFRASVPNAKPSSIPPAAAAVDLGAVLARITENDAPRWMVVKDNLDHGPFSGRELVQLILDGQVLGQHKLLNMDTGERNEVQKWADFAEFLAQYQEKKKQEAHKQALVRSAKAEKRSTAAKVGLAALLAGVLIAGVSLFVASRKAAVRETTADADLANLYERGQIEIAGTAGVLPEPRRRSGSGGARRSGGAGGLSYEDAMNQAMELGDVSKGGGEQRLPPATVAGVMNKHVNSFFGCVGQELRKGGSLGTVQIDLAIAGSGEVLGASVRPGSPEFQSCVAAKARAVRFPTFSAPRMGARYSFSVD